MAFADAYAAAYDKKVLGGDLLTNSNQKVKAWLFSLPPVKSCLNSSSCEKDCYALKAYKQYPSAAALWDFNFHLVKNNLTELYNRLDKQLAKIAKSKMRVVRIHQSGDFYSAEYVEVWHKLAAKYPMISFYGYTKVDSILDLTKFESLDNVAIVKSLVAGKYRNYGTINYVNRMAAKHDAIVCPATYGENKAEVKCNLHCNACTKKDTNVFFVQH